MENLGEVDHHHGGGRNGESQETVEIVTLQEFSQFLASQPKKLYPGSWQRRQIQKVPPQVRRRRRRSEHVYDPVMVSLGPYHHGKQELRRAEEFKYLCLDWCAGGDEKKKAFFYNKIVEKIKVIRDCYAEVTIVEKYDDKTLALMMLLDACILINFMHNCAYANGNNYLDWQNCLGVGSITFMARDMMLLENQIPFQILQLLISLQYGREESEGFIPRFLCHVSCGDINEIEIPGGIEEPPVHFLEAWWRMMAKKRNSRPVRREWPRFWTREDKIEKKTCNASYAHRSVMELKAKGIHVRPNFSPSLVDITFTSHAFHGQLRLPGHRVSDLCLVTFSNLIAYEVSPNCKTNDLVALPYMMFMKSLIQGPEDVKELQERGILLNKFANLEKAVELFKEIDTLGFQGEDIFMEVKQKIEEHCNSKAKTWIADLIHTRFRTPWAAIAVFAAGLLLCLTFLQTVFTIHPLKSSNNP